MNPMIEWFTVFALVVFSICCVVVAYRTVEEFYACRFYNALRNEIARAAIDIEAIWLDGEAIPAKDVYYILVQLVRRELVLDPQSLRDIYGEANSH